MDEQRVTPRKSSKRKRKTDVKMDENLPIITIVLTAENHLGYIASEYVPQKQEELQQRLRRCFQQVVDFAIEQGVDLFIQAGDLFDTVNPDEIDRSFVASRLRELQQAGVRVFAVGGMHDTPGEVGAVQPSANEQGSVPVYQDIHLAPQESYAHLGALDYFAPHSGELEPVFVDIRGVQVGICGLNVTAVQHGNPLASVRVPDAFARAELPLLIMHGPIEALSFTTSISTPQLDTHTEISQASIENQTTFRVILAGYHHTYHHLRLGQCDLIVAGTTQQLDFKAADTFITDHEMVDGLRSAEREKTLISGSEPGFIFIGLAADGVRWCKHMPVDALEQRRIELHTNEIWLSEDVQEQEIIDDAVSVPAQRIIDHLKPLCSKDALVYVRLEGKLSRDQYHQLDLQQVRQFGDENCFALAIDESGLEIVAEKPEGQSLSETELPEQKRLSAREELIALADEWIAAASAEQEKKALRATKEELLAIMDSR
jgi:hypothetical protein